MAMGCYHPDHSDIDLLAVIKDKQSKETYKRIAKQLMAEEERLGVKGIEFSIVLESVVRCLVYPTPFEFHYSPFHRGRYKADENYFCGNSEDPDLAAHFGVTYQRGICLYGKPVREVFKPVDRRYFLQSIRSDVDEALKEIVNEPVYYALNLCRVLLFLKLGMIASKREGGEWALKALPSEYAIVADQCLAQYNGHCDKLELSQSQLVDFAKYMLERIENALSLQ
ncbi:streptomycin 3''-adenylyltransferase [Paenibacillus sp. J2TS4]|nr:streptomycin 3''-adenylyltransferase [Paenibacillus sp. J2TS4]